MIKNMKLLYNRLKVLHCYISYEQHCIIILFNEI